MARNTFKNWTNAIKFLYSNRFDLGIPSADNDFDNDKPLSFSDANDTFSIPGLKADLDNRIAIDQETYLGGREPLQFYINANGGLATQTFYIANRPLTIVGIQYSHATAGNDAAAVTAAIFKDSGTQAPGAGASVMSGTFNCKAAANTPQSATLLAVDGNGKPAAGVTLAAGDRLSIKFTGTLTSLAGVVVTVFVAPGFKEISAGYAMNANGSLGSEAFFLAPRNLTIRAVRMIWSAAGTDAGAVTIDVTKDTGTTAPAGGTSVLTAAVNAKTAANTVNTPALSATASVLKLAAGDRLSVKFTGTLTALAGVVVEVYFTAVGVQYIGECAAVFHIKANGSQATQPFFIADRDYEVADVLETHSTAGTDVGSVTLDIQIDRGTTAPGSGATVLGSTFNLKSTANTTVENAPSTTRSARFLSAGDRLSAVYTGTLTSLAGELATVVLIPR